jgi:hypothetical protein
LARIERIFAAAGEQGVDVASLPDDAAELLVMYLLEVSPGDARGLVRIARGGPYRFHQ